ncbi:MAG: radical SAM protein, partial [Myxococcales bacterium]|nr:radical SAM protein [Myxococcales bacterium]
MPFCERACPYCDFDFRVGRRPGIDGAIEAWFAGLDTELARRPELSAAPPDFDTVYLGGGTPSALGSSGLARLLDWIEDRLGLRLATQAEVTVELNPEHLDDELLGVLRDRGVGRVSLGVQSLDP